MTDSAGRIEELRASLDECNRAWRAGVEEPLSLDDRLALVDELATILAAGVAS